MVSWSRGVFADGDVVAPDTFCGAVCVNPRPAFRGVVFRLGGVFIGGDALVSAAIRGVVTGFWTGCVFSGDVFGGDVFGGDVFSGDVFASASCRGVVCVSRWPGDGLFCGDVPVSLIAFGVICVSVCRTDCFCRLFCRLRRF